MAIKATGTAIKGIAIKKISASLEFIEKEINKI